MRTRIFLVAATVGFLSACATPPPDNFPSLAPRPQEAIDPRVPIPNEVRVDPADPSLSAHLAALVDQAEAGDVAFRSAAERAEQLANASGEPQSESWVAAQQSLSAAQEARGPTTRALGDIDALAANSLQKNGGIPAGNLAAIQAAAAKVSEIDRVQSVRIDAFEKRLGI
jgi:hypothetical protein